MKIFYNFLDLQDLTQRTLLTIFYSCLPLDLQRGSARVLCLQLVRTIQSFELGILALESDRHNIWLRPMKNQEFFLFMSKQFKKNVKLEQRVRAFLKSLRSKEEMNILQE